MYKNNIKTWNDEWIMSIVGFEHITTNGSDF